MMGMSSSTYVQLWVHVIYYNFHLAASERAGWGSLRADPCFDFHVFTLGWYKGFEFINGISFLVGEFRI